MVFSCSRDRLTPYTIWPGAGEVMNVAEPGHDGEEHPEECEGEEPERTEAQSSTDTELSTKV